ncbi:MAG: MMPL family transporter [Acidimicrobiia bacterium]
MLERLARLCFNHRRVVVVAWIVGLIAVSAAAAGAGSAFETKFELPNSGSKTGQDILQTYFGGGGGGRGTIVFRADQGVTDPTVQAGMQKVFDAVTRPGVVVVSPYDAAGASHIAQIPAVAGKIAYADVVTDIDVPIEQFKDLLADAQKATPTIDGLTVELGGDVFRKFEAPSSEVFGLVFAIFILLLAFGSVLAMGLPIGVALFGIGSGIGVIGLTAHLTAMPDMTSTLAGMIGLGVGIDYALFIVTRYREGLHRGLSVEDSIVVAMDTAGRAVLFAGITVMISLLGMRLMGFSFVRGLGIGASITVAMTVLASLTLLPALLAMAQRRVEVTRYRALIAVILLAIALFGIGIHTPALAIGAFALAALTIAAGFVLPALKAEVPRRATKPMRETFWFKWSRLVQHHPWPMALIGLVALVVMALPIFSLRLGFSDDGNFPSDTSIRRAYDLLSEGFGAGFNGPVIAAATLPEGFDTSSLASITNALRSAEGVVFVSDAVLNDAASPKAVQWYIAPATSPQDERTTKLVHDLRDDVIPAATSASNLDIALTGPTASNIDFADFMAKRMPVFFGAVLILSFLLLMAVFRSLLVPLKAVIMNLLSIGAAYGVVVAVFQWGWAKDLVGIGRGGPIEAWAPMMIFAIVFGLSMDYEVFLMSRMREEFDRTGDNATAVADGLATTARVISAAAAIMVFVFGSFLLEADRSIKLFGTALGVAVLLDATIVRLVLVPSTMELLGARNWWLPAWIDKVLPRLNVEGGHHEAELEAIFDEELTGTSQR